MPTAASSKTTKSGTTKSGTTKSGTTKSGTTDTHGTELGDALPGVNLVVLRGVASAPAEQRTLRSGSALSTLSVRVPGPPDPGQRHATSVPVAVWDPPAWVDGIDVDDPIVVVGTLQRRFFRTEGGTGARVEVVATLIGRGGDRRRLEAAERRALAALEGLD